MNVVDSSGWLEYFADGKNDSFFEPPILKTTELLVPTISLYEVFKKVYQLKGESEALVVVALMQQGTVVNLDASLAFSAARISAESSLSMAESIILASARASDAVLWTQDRDFDGMDGVRYIHAA